MIIDSIRIYASGPASLATAAAETRFRDRVRGGVLGAHGKNYRTSLGAGRNGQHTKGAVASAAHIERTKAAGIAVGERSELDSPQRLRPRQRPKKRPETKGNRRKDHETIPAERDALHPSHRVPGSFENGKRR